MKSVFIALLCLTILSACGKTDQREILMVVAGYEKALSDYDSKQAMAYLHPDWLAQFNSESEYHSMMKKAFSAIEKDGGIMATEKSQLTILANSARLNTVIKTHQHQQQGVIELKKHQGKWLISNLP